MTQDPDPTITPSALPMAGGGVLSKPGFFWVQVWTAILSLTLIASLLAALAHATGLFIPTLAFILCAIAACYDAATGPIPNPLTYTGILLGLAFNSLAAAPAMAGAAHWLGSVGAPECLAGFGLCAGIGLVCRGFGMGGGDMKVIAALGALLGLQQCMVVLVMGLAAAVVYALINLAAAGRLNRVMALITVQLLELMYLHRMEPLPQTSRRHAPAAVPLAVGLVVSRIGMAQHWSFWPFA